MCCLRVLIGVLLVAGCLSADQIYTWVAPPNEFGTEPDQTPLYDGIIEIAEPYAAPTIAYGGVTYDIDVANYNSPESGLEEFYVMTVADPDPPPSIPEPALWPLTGIALAGIGVLKNRKTRRAKLENFAGSEI